MEAMRKQQAAFANFAGLEELQDDSDLEDEEAGNGKASANQVPFFLFLPCFKSFGTRSLLTLAAPVLRCCVCHRRFSADGCFETRPVVFHVCQDTRSEQECCFFFFCFCFFCFFCFFPTFLLFVSQAAS